MTRTRSATRTPDPLYALPICRSWKGSLKPWIPRLFSLAMDNKLPIGIVNLRTKGNIQKVVCGENIGTYIGD